MLQRLTEDLEYHELLDKAVKCESSTEQMCFVAAFSVSSYSTTVHRTAKPFNPLLGETYELDRLEELGFRSLCEQVSWERGLRRDSVLCPVAFVWPKQPFPEGDWHLLALSLPPGPASRQVAGGIGRSSSRCSPSPFPEADCAHPGDAEQEVGRKGRRKVSIALPGLLLLLHLNT